MKKITILIILLFCVAGCSNYLLNLWLRDYIKAYKQPPATKEQFNDAMTLFFYTYPEFHITPRIYEQSILTNSANHESLEVKKRLGLVDSANFESMFFRHDSESPNGNIWSYYKISLKKNTIYLLCASDWLYMKDLKFWGRFSIVILRVAFQKDNYKWKWLGDLTRAESNAAEEEFETDILPKIQECLEIVKERDKAKTESVPER